MDRVIRYWLDREARDADPTKTLLERPRGDLPQRLGEPALASL